MNWRVAFLTTAILCALTAPIIPPAWGSVGIYLLAGLFGGFVVRRLELGR